MLSRALVLGVYLHTEMLVQRHAEFQRINRIQTQPSIEQRVPCDNVCRGNVLQIQGTND